MEKQRGEDGNFEGGYQSEDLELFGEELQMFEMDVLEDKELKSGKEENDENEKRKVEEEAEIRSGFGSEEGIAVDRFVHVDIGLEIVELPVKAAVTALDSDFGGYGKKRKLHVCNVARRHKKISPKNLKELKACRESAETEFANAMDQCHLRDFFLCELKSVVLLQSEEIFRLKDILCQNVLRK